MLDDVHLLRDYAENRSEKSFAELVRRHTNLVYSAALRRNGGDPHRAREVVQFVFNELARQPERIARHPALAGWLHTATRNASINAARAERRRQHYEAQAALTMNDTAEPEAEAWGRIRPILDEVIDEMGRDDRDAIVLRFFEQAPFAEIGRVLRTSEDGARMRVQRALEKMRHALERREITSTVAALSAALSIHTATAAPAGFATTVAGVALAGAAPSVSEGLAAMWSGLGGLKGATIGIGIVTLIAGVTFAFRRNAGARPQDVPSAMTASLPAVTHAAKVSANAPLANSGGTSSVIAPLTPAASPGASPRVNPFPAPSAAAAGNRAKIAREYDTLLAALQLSADEREAVISLLVDLRESGADFAAAGTKIGIDVTKDPRAFNKAVRAQREGLQRELQALVGDEGYRRYLAAEEELQLESYAIVLEKRLRSTPTPLSPAQARELTWIIKQRTFDPKGERLIEEASQILSSTQLEALRAVQDIKRNGTRNEKVREAIRAVREEAANATRTTGR